MSAGGERRSDDLYPDAPWGTWPGFVKPYEAPFWCAAERVEHRTMLLHHALRVLTHETATDGPARIVERVKAIVERWDALQADMRAMLDVIARIEAADEKASPAGSQGRNE